MSKVAPEAVPQSERAVELAYRALATRDRTSAELRTYLERKRVDPAAIDHAIGELTGAGFIDDARFARRFADDKRSLERWGSERIERDLLRRGVPADLVHQAVSEQGRGEELEAALALLADRVPPPADDRERDRAWRLLVRKGYQPELAYDAVRAHGERSPA